MPNHDDYDIGLVVGDRVRLISTTDEHTALVPGEIGVVRHIDSLGTIHCDWSDGSRLGLVAGEDRWELIVEDE